MAPVIQCGRASRPAAPVSGVRLGRPLRDSLAGMASWRTTVRGMGAAALALAVWACTPQVPPGVLVGESAHFRLFVDPDLTGIPTGLAGESGLVALETEWADVQTMLKMPDGKIDYYW